MFCGGNGQCKVQVAATPQGALRSYIELPKIDAESVYTLQNMLLIA